jgi:hypothetical protein
MDRAETHIIQRQVFDLSTSSSKEGFECQRRVSGYLQHIINPQLEVCFNQLQLGNRHLVIDKLEIDLGTFTIESFEKEAAARLAELLSSQLRSYMEAARQGKKATHHHTHKDTADSEVFSNSSEAVVHLIQDAKAFQMVLQYFLLHGRFPWWYTTEKQTSIPDEQFDILHITTLQSAEKGTFREILRTSQAARIRLVNHFSAGWLAKFLQSIDMAGAAAERQWIRLLPAIRAFSATLPLFHQNFWMAWIEAACNNIQTINITLLIEKTAGGYNDTAIAAAKVIHTICKENSHQGVWAGYAEVIEKYLRHKMPYDAFRKQLLNEVGPVALEFSAKEEALNTHTTTEQTAQEKATTGFGEEDALFVPAAGLVILHPFLTELFTSTGLWQNKQWQTEDSVYKAIQMLSQLVYGETRLPEYQLPFFKILTGLDPDAPLPAQPPLTIEETQTCTELLQAVIAHWTALRNTSPAALQEGFLQRQGKLIKNEKGYHLTVERLAQDVLLSRLPWGYSMIKLPWMESMLHVTWI